VNQNKRIQISIAIPCFNEEKTLERCLQYVLAIQDVTLTTEIIVVDDCSTDNSFKIVEIPVCYGSWSYGSTNIDHWRHGYLLLKVAFFCSQTN